MLLQLLSTSKHQAYLQDCDKRTSVFSSIFPADVQLLKAGAQVHHVSKEGRSTALHEAVLRSHGDLVDMLLRASANPFLENGSGACLTMQSLLRY